VTLGPDQPFAPPPPTWREQLGSLGHPLETHAEIERACGEYGLPVDDLDTLLDGFAWEDRWDNLAGPQAKAHYLLKDLDLGQVGSALRQAGQIIFEEFGGSPANSFTWVELRDDLTVSLLQARLIELNLPINVAVARETERPTAASARGMSASRVRETWDYCSSIETRMGLLGQQRRSIFAVPPWHLMFLGQPLVS
jgi:hypothetical protein